MRLLLVLPWLFLLGCDSVQDVVAKQKPAVEKTFTAIQALGPRVAAMDPEAVPKVKAAPVVLESAGSATSNAMFIYAEDLQKPGEAKPVHLRTLDSVPLLQCGALLSKQTYFNDSITRPMPSVAEQYLTACARLKYVLVIRTREYTAPELSLETKRFAPGRYRADVLAFELGNGELLGGFPVTATNEASVMLLDGDANHTKRLISNLESTVFTALRDGARQAFPGSLPAARP